MEVKIGKQDGQVNLAVILRSGEQGQTEAISPVPLESIDKLVELPRYVFVKLRSEHFFVSLIGDGVIGISAEIQYVVGNAPAEVIVWIDSDAIKGFCRVIVRPFLSYSLTSPLEKR